MKRNEGFTITELMIAVVIMGVLATLAIPTFTSYIYKARVTEATNFLGEIKQRQESYRNEFGQYCADDADWGTYNPTTIPGADPVMWTSTTMWDQLGASPDVTPPTGTNLDDDDHWFAARAQADLDEDGVPFFVEIYSQSNLLYNSAAGKGGCE